MIPSASSPPIVYAVYLGCHNGKRLSAEWGIPLARACELLIAAKRAGLIERTGRGRYTLPRFKARNGPVARLRAMPRDPCRRFTTRKTA